MKKERKLEYVLIYWLDQNPQYCVFPDEESAKMAAIIRNGMVIILEGDYEIVNIVDYYKRDKEGNAIPAKKRELGQFGIKLLRGSDEVI